VRSEENKWQARREMRSEKSDERIEWVSSSGLIKQECPLLLNLEF